MILGEARWIGGGAGFSPDNRAPTPTPPKWCFVLRVFSLLPQITRRYAEFSSAIVSINQTFPHDRTLTLLGQLQVGRLDPLEGVMFARSSAWRVQHSPGEHGKSRLGRESRRRAGIVLRRADGLGQACCRADGLSLGPARSLSQPPTNL